MRATIIDDAHDPTFHTHDVRVEFHEERGGKNESKVISEVAEHVSDLVADAERPHRSIGIVCHNVVSFSQDSIFGCTCLVRLPNEFRIPFLNHKREDLFY
ncbi:hypothetical protein WMO24_07485 [Ruthenibacterium sp. CLA-JM-H11]|uniref:Uncharacterized protein n=1 Tax=Ruthenibacterium intestinale TaxID=3133163 RepID=A0ABV1GEZ8_9FIRM